MKKFKVAALALAGSLGAAPAANAIAIDGTPTPVCLNFLTFVSCASVSVTVSGSTLTAVVSNLTNTAPSNLLVGKLTEFGFFYLPGQDLGTLELIEDGNTPDGWSDGVGSLTNPLASAQGGSWLGGAQGDTGDDFIAPGGSATFEFEIDGTPDWSKVFFGWRGQDVAENTAGFGSIKCYGSPDAESEPAGATCDPPTTIPEPATMALLATGLVGMGGMTFIRRRKKQA